MSGRGNLYARGSKKQYISSTERGVASVERVSAYSKVGSTMRVYPQRKRTPSKALDAHLGLDANFEEQIAMTMGKLCSQIVSLTCPAFPPAHPNDKKTSSGELVSSVNRDLPLPRATHYS